MNVIHLHADQCLDIKEQHTQHLKELHATHQKEVSDTIKSSHVHCV